MWKLWKSSKTEGIVQGDWAEIRARLQALESRQNSLEVDWATTFAKTRRLLGHLTKTVAIDEQKAQAPPVAQKREPTIEEILAMADPL